MPVSFCRKLNFDDSLFVECGWLEEPPRRASGYRQYSEEVVKRIHFIKRAQQLGFSLKEITELLMLRVDGQTSCEEVKRHAEAKIAEVERKVIELQRMRQALREIAALCTGTGPGPIGVCGIRPVDPISGWARRDRGTNPNDCRLVAHPAYREDRLWARNLL
jgi:DNA-binding transcriptional MerR regulator